MSANHSRPRNAKIHPIPHCNVCQKAGKSKMEYSSHWPSSLVAGKNVALCPLILASECSYCHKNGHFIKFCPVLVEKQKKDSEGIDSKVTPRSISRMVVMNKRKNQIIGSIVSTNMKMNRNMFQDLESDSDAESDTESDVSVSEPVKKSRKVPFDFSQPHGRLDWLELDENYGSDSDDDE
jgi:hypothetical protein